MAKAFTLPSAGTAAVQRAQRGAGMNSRAWSATRKMQSMLPMLTRYARAVLRDPKVRVLTTHQVSYTDGKDIYIQPPMLLGEDHIHSVGNCGVRDENKRIVCQACDTHEIVMALVYHEISHILFGSFVTPENKGRRAFTSLVVEWHPPHACDHGIEIIEAMAEKESYLLIAECFDPRLPLAMNALEDARVNRSMLTARPGTEAMFDARAHQIFTNDAEQGDGTTKPWSEMPVDAQVGIGMLLAASGYQLHLDVFHPEVKAILDDDVLVDLAAKIGSSKDMHELAVHTCEVWRRFQDLGVFVKEKCVPPPPEDEEDDEPQDQDDDADEPDEDSGPGLLGENGDGGGSSTGDETESEGESDGDSSAEQQPSKSDRDPTAGGGSGSSPGPGSSEPSGGDAEQDRQPGDVPDVPESDNKSEDSGGGDRVQDGRDSGDQDEVSSEASSGGNGDDDEQDSDGGNPVGDESDGSEGASGKELADGGQEEAGQQSEAGEDEGDDDESPGSEPEGGSPGGSERAGEEPGVTPGGEEGDDGSGTEGVSTGVDPSSGEDGDGGPDEGEDSDPADFTPATVEQLVAAIQAGSLHGLFGPDSTENFAGGHSLLNTEPAESDLSELWAAALQIAGMQAFWFEGASEEVGKVQVIPFGENGGIAGFNLANVRKTELAPSREIVGPVVTKGRITFSPNKRSRHETGLKSGKINPRALSTIPLGNEALFRKKHIAARKSYHVIITMDVSGSTDSKAPSQHYPDQTTLQMIQRSVFAQAEALASLNISFEVWAHTANYFLTRAEHNAHFEKDDGWDTLPPLDVWLLHVKGPDDRWDDAARQRMHALRPLGGNLDGHTLQIMRKKADEAKRKFTNVIICYYTDGAMPASNYQEEGEILQVETELCRRKGYTLLAVGAGTDSPKNWGFDTVKIESDSDFPLVMAQLERTIL